jgi:hypothetical protein
MDQPQKPCPECNAPGNDRRDLSLGKTWRQCEKCFQEYFVDSPKPDATLREWWLEEDPKEIECTNVTFSDPRPAAKGWVYHVIEKSAYDALELRRAEWTNRYAKVCLEHDALSARLFDAEEQVRDAVLSGRNNATFKELRIERDALKQRVAELEAQLEDLWKMRVQDEVERKK